ncbi:hypothetical protein WH47_07305 [Habropoda laboriosa]|uniref:Histone-lysine N-methyltransferase SETMAR n=1 Tax=Habropoda laboriosa TaxID=597456 RepID=A0A0L7R639_9HYME|nr:hypothetical protein WH47_07305 [Habropoda laboriosa]
MHKKLKDLCPILVNLKGPILLHDHMSHEKIEKNFKTQAAAGNASEELIDSRTPEFSNTGIKKLVSRWQKCTESITLF